jgi:hypothetical protein
MQAPVFRFWRLLCHTEVCCNKSYKEYRAKVEKFEILDRVWASELQIDLNEYMLRLYESLEGDEGSEAEEWGINTESGQPFCGCDVCEGREILSFLTGRIIKGYKESKIQLSSESESSESSSGEEGSSGVISCRSEGSLEA